MKRKWDIHNDAEFLEYVKEVYVYAATYEMLNTFALRAGDDADLYASNLVTWLQVNQ